MDNFTTSLAILSAMLTPAVLISSCASLAISTSQRLSRIIDRARKLSTQFKEIMLSNPDSARMQEGDLLLDQITRATRRARLLQRALTSIYLALTIFVATSVAIAIVAVTNETYAWVAILFGVIGVALLFRASLLLITEAYIARTAIDQEMKFFIDLAEHQAPKDMLERHKPRKSKYWPILPEIHR